MSDQVNEVAPVDQIPAAPEPVKAPEGPKWSYGPDGIEFEATYPGTATTPAVKFKYRPMDQETLIRNADKVKDQTAATRWDRMRDTLRTRLISWDLLKAAGQPVDFKNDAELKGVPPGIIFYISGAIADAGGFVDEAVGKL